MNSVNSNKNSIEYLSNQFQLLLKSLFEFCIFEYLCSIGTQQVFVQFWQTTAFFTAPQVLEPFNCLHPGIQSTSVSPSSFLLSPSVLPPSPDSPSNLLLLFLLHMRAKTNPRIRRQAPKAIGVISLALLLSGAVKEG